MRSTPTGHTRGAMMRAQCLGILEVPQGATTAATKVASRGSQSRNLWAESIVSLQGSSQTATIKSGWNPGFSASGA